MYASLPASASYDGGERAILATPLACGILLMEQQTAVITLSSRSLLRTLLIASSVRASFVSYSSSLCVDVNAQQRCCKVEAVQVMYSNSHTWRTLCLLNASLRWAMWLEEEDAMAALPLERSPKLTVAIPLLLCIVM